MIADGSKALIGTFHLVGDDVETCLERALGLLGVALADPPPGRLRISDLRRRPARFDHHGRQGGWLYLPDDGTLAWPLAVQLARLSQSQVLALVVHGSGDGDLRKFSAEESLVLPEGKRVTARPSAIGWLPGDVEGLPEEMHQALAAVVARCATYWTRGDVVRQRSLDVGVLPTTGSPALDEVLGFLRLATRSEVREEPGQWLVRATLPDGRTMQRGVSDDQLARIRAVAGALL
jgi:hypothetical protein